MSKRTRDEDQVEPAAAAAAPQAAGDPLPLSDLQGRVRAAQEALRKARETQSVYWLDVVAGHLDDLALALATATKSGA